MVQGRGDGRQMLTHLTGEAGVMPVEPFVPGVERVQDAGQRRGRPASKASATSCAHCRPGRGHPRWYGPVRAAGSRKTVAALLTLA
ncbi:hypothetical protein Ari01nite_47400 [Paractinoplanes rishiriensis]|uniref:Uncharacterized protein n=1 Tax=Paractinoplanes rishiriensis TaxID=1050105 RepID=A0A919JYK2_9ACTN|nr:hypothetical protein Ari01nite_47400 [Actinoplanes rishiriensis]